MKVIIAGSREGITANDVDTAIRESGFVITEVVSGGARGVDRMGEQYARYYGIPIRQFIPDWNGIGKSAGFRRNEQMADYADALIAVWDAVSHGTEHMIRTAEKRGLAVFVHIPVQQSPN